MNGINGTSSGPSVGVRPGDGIVVRRGPVIAVARASAGIERVLDAVATFDIALGSAVDLLRVVRALDASSAVAIAVVGAEVDVVLLGDARCEVDGPAGHVHFEGSHTAQLVGLPPELHQVTVMLDAPSSPAAAWSALADGVVPGAGADIRFVAPLEVAPIVAASSGAQPPPPPPPVASLPPPPPPPVPVASMPEPVPAQASAAVVNVLLAPLEPAELPAPLPNTPPPPAPAPAHAADARPMVRGLACAVGHVNRVEANYCSACGRRLQGTISLVDGPRPSLGTLIFDDGAIYGLERGYIIGREPAGDPQVTGGAAGAIALSDDQRAISRVHADVRLDGWDTQIVDRGSANGTHVAAPGAGWVRLEPNVPVTIGDGWSVAIGRRTFVFQQR
jgi:hypothetical protein